jgi:hypothetical protein
MRLIALIIVSALLAPLPAKAGSEFGAKEEAVAMVKRVQEMFAEKGVDATFTTGTFIRSFLILRVSGWLTGSGPS